MERKITVNVLVWVLGNLCRRHRIPFEAGLLLQQLPSASPDGYDVAELLAAADRLGLQFGENRVSTLLAAPDHVFPCLAFLQPDSSAGLQPVLIVRAPRGAFACCAPGASEPRDIDLSALLPTAYSFSAKPEAVKDEDGKPIAAEKEFGFSWFIPELRRHRQLWYEILLASLTIQLVVLATPLFTQVKRGCVPTAPTAIRGCGDIYYLTGWGDDDDLEGGEGDDELWGTRTVAEYLLSPVQKAWHEAGRER